jgi:hypothetical protein
MKPYDVMDDLEYAVAQYFIEEDHIVNGLRALLAALGLSIGNLLFIAIVATLCTSCGGNALDRQVTYEMQSTIGVTYKYLSVTPWDPGCIDNLEATFSTCVALVPGYEVKTIRESLSHAMIYITPDKFACLSSPSGYCNGEEDGPDIVVRNMGAPTDSELRFELARWLELDIKNITDYSLDKVPQETPIEPELWRCT